MALQKKGMHGAWASRWTFIMAATGSAVGLGNMWKFPYVAGSNGGGAFVLIYLLCILIIGVPVMMAEVLIGRQGRQSPINSVNDLVSNSHINKAWLSIGWFGVIAGLLILSFYAVIAGWALKYIVLMAMGDLQGVDGTSASSVFESVLADPIGLIFWQTVFLFFCVIVVMGGVKKGLGLAIEILMPILFIVIFLLFVFCLFNTDVLEAMKFLFSFDLSNLSGRSLLEAMGQAFFTLSIGMGAIMAYGAYMPQDASIGKTVLTVAFFDSLVAIISGIIIFSIVFSTSGLEPTAGPGLMFISLPIAFGNMTGGLLVGTLFFVLVSIAAWSSAISLLEPSVAWLMEEKNIGRVNANLLVVLVAWILGIGSVFSFNIWQNSTIFNFTFFDFLDFLTSNIMLPITGLLIAIFVGYVMSNKIINEQIGFQSSIKSIWMFLLKFIAPCAVSVVFVAGIIDKFFNG